MDAATRLGERNDFFGVDAGSRVAIQLNNMERPSLTRTEKGKGVDCDVDCDVDWEVSEDWNVMEFDREEIEDTNLNDDNTFSERRDRNWLQEPSDRETSFVEQRRKEFALCHKRSMFSFSREETLNFSQPTCSINDGFLEDTCAAQTSEEEMEFLFSEEFESQVATAGDVGSMGVMDIDNNMPVTLEQEQTPAYVLEGHLTTTRLTLGDTRNIDPLATFRGPESFTEADAAMVQIMGVGIRSRVNVSAMEQLIKLTVQYAESGVLKSSNLPSYKTMINRLSDSFRNVPMPIFHRVPLENEKFGKDGTVATYSPPMPVFSFLHQLVDLLSEPVFADIDNLVVNKENPFSPYEVGSCRSSVTELQDGYWFQNTVQALKRSRQISGNEQVSQHSFPIGIVLYTDKTSNDAYSKHGIEPLMFSVTLLKEAQRRNPKHWRPLAYIPPLNMKSSAGQRRQKGAERMMKNYHHCLKIGMKSMVDVINGRGVGIHLRIGNQVRIVRPIFLLNSVLADGLANDALTNRQKMMARSPRISRTCHTPQQYCGSHDSKCRPLRADAMERLTIAALGPEDIPGTDPTETISGTQLENHLDHPLREPTTFHAYIEHVQGQESYASQKKEAKTTLCQMMRTRKKISTLVLQKVFGSYVVDNAFYEVGMGSNLAGPFGVTGTDIMHANDEGVSKDGMQVIINPMTDSNKEGLDRLADCLFNASYNRGYAKSNLFPRCNFTGGFSSLTNLTADENAGKLIVVSILLETVSGLQIFEKRVANDFDEKRRNRRDQLSGKKKKIQQDKRSSDTQQPSNKRKRAGVGASFPYTPLFGKGEGNDKLTYMFVWDDETGNGKWVEGITTHWWMESHRTVDGSNKRYNTYFNEYKLDSDTHGQKVIYDRELLLAMEAHMLMEDYNNRSWNLLSRKRALKKDAVGLKIRNWVQEKPREGDPFMWKRITGKVKKYLPNPDRSENKQEKNYLVKYDDEDEPDEYLDEEHIRNMLIVQGCKYWGGGKRGLFMNADMVSVNERLTHQLDAHGLPFLMEWKDHLSEFHKHRMMGICYKEMRELPKNERYYKNDLDKLRIPCKEKDNGTWKHCADRRKHLYSQECVNRYMHEDERVDVTDIHSPYVYYSFVQGTPTQFPAEEECVAYNSDEEDNDEEEGSPEDQHVSLNMNGDVRLLRRIVQLLCGMTAFLRYGNKVTDNTRHQKMEEAVRLTVKELTEMVFRDTNSLGWNKQKVHDLLHVVMYDMKLFGSPTNNTTDKGESGLKTWAKRPADYAGLATGAENFTKGVAMHYYRTRLIECGEDQYKSIIDDDTKAGILRYPYRKVDRSDREHCKMGSSKYGKIPNDNILEKLYQLYQEGTCLKRYIGIYSEAVVEASVNGPNEKPVQLCYRADPNYNGTGPWYDWCWMRRRGINMENDVEDSNDWTDIKILEPVKIVAFFVGDSDTKKAVVVPCRPANGERSMVDKKLHSHWECEENRLRVVNVDELGIPCMAMHLNNGCGGLEELAKDDMHYVQEATQHVLVMADRKLHWPDIYLNMCEKTKETWDRRS